MLGSNKFRVSMIFFAIVPMLLLDIYVTYYINTKDFHTSLLLSVLRLLVDIYWIVFGIVVFVYVTYLIKESLKHLILVPQSGESIVVEKESLTFAGDITSDQEVYTVCDSKKYDYSEMFGIVYHAEKTDKKIILKEGDKGKTIRNMIYLNGSLNYDETTIRYSVDQDPNIRDVKIANLTRKLRRTTDLYNDLLSTVQMIDKEYMATVKTKVSEVGEIAGSVGKTFEKINVPLEKVSPGLSFELEKIKAEAHNMGNKRMMGLVLRMQSMMQAMQNNQQKQIPQELLEQNEG